MQNTMNGWIMKLGQGTAKQMIEKLNDSGTGQGEKEILVYV